MNKKIGFEKHVHFQPFIDDEEIEAVVQVLKERRLTLLSSEKVEEFETEFAKYIGVKHAIAVNSGTAALHVALASLELGPGDEVIVPPFTFVATATAVLHQNAIPIFVDILPDTYCIDPLKIEAAITSKTKAIIPVHIFGHPADMDQIIKIGKEHEIPVIEDACQAHGAEYKGKKVGSIGDIGCFSFFESKNMMTGEGGIITTNDDEIAEKCKLIRHHGEPYWYQYIRLGYNYRMTAIQAAIGLIQLKKLEKMNNKRIEYAQYYNKNLKGLSGLQLPITKNYVKHVYHLYAPLIKPEELGIDKDKFLELVNKDETITKLIYPQPLYKSPLFQNLVGYGPKSCPFSCPYYGKQISYDIHLPVVENICNRAIGLPNLPSTDLNQIDKVIETLRKVIGELQK
ncbi:MAG: DegT/DnrJ/EryC1/StrS family aminotransferase [Candidatus Helarchaeota archaeon]